MNPHDEDAKINKCLLLLCSLRILWGIFWGASIIIADLA